MARRIVGAVVVLLVLAGLGAGAGYVVGRNDAQQPATFAVPQSVPAERPSFPVNVYDVEPDPDTAPLGTGLALHEERFRANGFRLRAPVPDGWRRVAVAGGTRWQFTDPDNPSNTYILRIEIVASDTQTTGVQAQSRMIALRQQEDDGNAENLIFEDESETGFTFTEIDVGGHQRVGIERFESVPGNSSAYFTVAVNGREVDRDGLVDLIDQVVEGAYVP